MIKATEKRIYLTRHGQAEHNVVGDWYIRDPRLTLLGKQQSAKLHEDTKDTIQQTAELLVTSGMRRTLSTTLIGYATLRQRLEQEGKPVIVLPQLQEGSNKPCDTGSSLEELEADPEFAGLDLSTLTPDWICKYRGFYEASLDKVKARARWVRKWLRARPEREIVVVSHGDFLSYIIEKRGSYAQLANAEVREYTFAVEEEQDTEGEAWLALVRKVVQEGENEPTSSSF